MTAVGKILVFVNLVFSLLVGALVMMVYVARTNWAAGYDQMKKRADILNVERDQSVADLTKVSSERDLAVKEKNDTITLLGTQIEANKGEIARLTKALEAEKQKGQQALTNEIGR